MNAKLLLLIGICYLSQSTFAQSETNQKIEEQKNSSEQTSSSSSSPSQSDAKEKEAEQTLKEIKDQLAEIRKLIKEGKGDEKLMVGKIKMKKKEGVLVYEYDNDSDHKQWGSNKFKKINSKTVNIDTIHITCRDGYILNIDVITKNDGVFSNQRAPIELSSDRIKNSDMLGNGENQYLDISEILEYTSIKNYAPDEDDFYLTDVNVFHYFSKGIGINSIFDIRLYSDAFGIFGKKPNGLIQTDLYFKYVYYRKNINNTGIFLFNQFKLNVTGSKFDSKLAFTDSLGFTRTSLYQKSWFNIDLSENMMNGWIGRGSLSSYYLDTGLGVSLSNLATSKDTTTITSVHFFFKAGADFAIGENWGFSISTKLIWTYAPEIRFGTSQRTFSNTGIGLYWNPVGNKANRFFIRFAYNVGFSELRNHFAQLQLGYNVRLTSLVK